MEDLWLFEFHPSKRGLSAKLEKENKEKMKWDDMLHFGILYEISLGGNASVQINMKCSLVRPPGYCLAWEGRE